MKEFRTLNANEIDCRVSQIASNYCTLLLYKDARVDMNILDETVGPMNWQKSYLRENANCIVSIYDDAKKQWVSKEDTGTESFAEAEKGLASDSFKRACFNWGIGRELYTAPSIIIFPKKEIKYKYNGKEVDEFYQNEKGKYETKTRFWVEYIDYVDKSIKNLIIRDNKGNIRFEQLTKEKEQELSKIDLKLHNLIEQEENNDEKFNREKFYANYKVGCDAQMTYKQKEEAIKLLGDK